MHTKLAAAPRPMPEKQMRNHQEKTAVVDYPPYVHKTADAIVQRRKLVEPEAEQHSLLRRRALTNRFNQHLRRLFTLWVVVVFVFFLIEVNVVSSWPAEHHGVGLQPAETETLDRKRLAGAEVLGDDNVRETPDARILQPPLQVIAGVRHPRGKTTITTEISLFHLGDDAQTSTLFQLRRELEQRVPRVNPLLRRLRRGHLHTSTDERKADPFTKARGFANFPLQEALGWRGGLWVHRPTGQTQELRPPVAGVFPLVCQSQHRRSRQVQPNSSQCAAPVYLHLSRLDVRDETCEQSHRHERKVPSDHKREGRAKQKPGKAKGPMEKPPRGPPRRRSGQTEDECREVKRGVSAEEANGEQRCHQIQ
mmetsp:Transcript_123/g.436  ORF Transcript_123/g.436 Transcript_123/m.436 type:complete len:365 (+) Transcript_123:1152-2246(+)